MSNTPGPLGPGVLPERRATLIITNIRVEYDDGYEITVQYCECCGMYLGVYYPATLCISCYRAVILSDRALRDKGL